MTSMTVFVLLFALVLGFGAFVWLLHMEAKQNQRHALSLSPKGLAHTVKTLEQRAEKARRERVLRDIKR